MHFCGCPCELSTDPSISVAFYVLSYLSKNLKIFVLSSIGNELEIAARWCLWAGVLITIGTALAGFYAYYTVKHDTTSHIAMTDHRNWAIATAAVAILIAIWSLWGYYKRKTIIITFILALLVMQGLLTSTAWKGGELVYRYGVGVMDLPNSMEGSQMDGHNHGSEDVKSPNENANVQSVDEEISPHTH